MRRALVVLNPTAAAGRAARELERQQPSLPSKGIDAVVQTSMAAGHVVELARAGAESGTFDVIVAAGGDGTDARATSWDA